MSGVKHATLLDKNGTRIIEPILDSINSGIVVIDKDGLVVYANKTCEKILNVSFEQIKEKHYNDAFAQIPYEERFTLITLETGREFKNIGSDKARFNNLYIITDTVLLKDEHGNVIGAAGIFKDITSLHELHKQLRESSKISMFVNMAAGMAHEILNPLTTIKGLTQILLQKSKEHSVTAESVYEYSQIMLSELENINNILGKLIDIARFKPVNTRTVDVNQLVQSATGLLANQFKEKSVQLELELCPDTIITIGDEVSLKQALLHLLDNALEMLPPGGKICIKTAKESDQIVITVADSGPGIPEDCLETIFTPFFSTSEGKKGLGLTITQCIIHSHNGHIEAENQQGAGACFKITLPYNKPVK